MVLEFKTQPQPRKKPKCSRGYPCGGSCINRQRNCKKKLRGQGRDSADWLKRTADAAARTKKKNQPVAPSKSSSISMTVERGRPDSAENQDYNRGLEKELASLYQEAERRANKEPELYTDNRDIISDIETNHSFFPKTTRVLRSASGKIEAVASFLDKEDSVHIEFLATSPKNVDRNDPEYVRGNGTRMIVEAAKESIKKGKKGGVTLRSLPGAVKFYEKLGFTGTTQDLMGIPIISMTLSEKNAQKLLDLALNFEELSLEDELEILELEAKGAFAGRK